MKHCEHNWYMDEHNGREVARCKYCNDILQPWQLLSSHIALEEIKKSLAPGMQRALNGQR